MVNQVNVKGLSVDHFKKIDRESARLIVYACFGRVLLPEGDYWVAKFHRDYLERLDTVVPPIGSGFFVMVQGAEAVILAYAPVVQLSLFGVADE